MSAIAATQPDAVSQDYAAMAPYWARADAFLEGVEAVRKLERILVPFAGETVAEHRVRLEDAPLTNIYEDILSNLTSRPFSREVQLSADAPEVLAGRSVEEGKKRTGGLVDDIDGRGRSLHVFAHEAFVGGVHRGGHWILVDYTRAPNTGPRARTRAEEAAMRLRPYWVQVPATSVLAAYWAQVDGKWAPVYVRMRETVVERDGEYGERSITQIREMWRDREGDVFGAARWRTLRQNTEQVTGTAAAWSKHDEGEYTIGILPIVYFSPARDGVGLRVNPPLRTVLNMQVEEFQQESNLKEVKKLTAFPMLVGEGVKGVDEKGQKIRVPVGPRAVLFLPPNPQGLTNATFKFIEPSAESLRFLKDDLEAFRKEMRDLGMQPLTTSNLTVVTTSNVSVKASSAVQAWAIRLEDALNQAMAITAMWLGIADTTEVQVFKDFSVDALTADDTEFLLKSRMAGEISRRTFWGELRRRGRLAPDFDTEREEKLLGDEEPLSDPNTNRSTNSGEGLEGEDP